MAQQGGNGNNTHYYWYFGGQASTPPRAPGAETPPQPPAVTPSPQPFLALSLAWPDSSNIPPVTQSTKSSAICPVCDKDMSHDKALNGHLRWHSLEQRNEAAGRVVRALASSVVAGTYERGSTSARRELPDLNVTPPSEGEE